MTATVSTGAILFTDMVDSTALRSRLGEDEADVLRLHHDHLLAAEVAAHSGTVARWTGDGVKAGFASASDAVAAAVSIQRAVVAYGLRADAVAVFQVRIGISAGEVTIDEAGDHHGVAVVEAARLEALARPGDILATEMVRMLGQRRANVEFEEVGERTLKGLDLPVRVYRVVDSRIDGTPAASIPRRRWPPPTRRPRRATRGVPGAVGRDPSGPGGVDACARAGRYRQDPLRLSMCRDCP